MSQEKKGIAAWLQLPEVARDVKVKAVAVHMWPDRTCARALDELAEFPPELFAYWRQLSAEQRASFLALARVFAACEENIFEKKEK